MSPRGRAAAACALGLAALVACGGPRNPSDAPAHASPEEVVRSLFDLAERAPVSRDALGAVVRPDAFDDDPGALLDALESLRGIDRLRVVASEPLDVAGRVALDVEGERAGPSLAAYSVQVEELADGTWRVAWFAGPDVEWPRRRAPRDGGLATSPPPGD